MSYRVVYGETRPAWEKIFPTMREAKAFTIFLWAFVCIGSLGGVVYLVRLL